MTTDTSRHLEIFKKHWKVGWINSNVKYNSKYDQYPEKLEEKFEEEWQEMLNEQEGKDIITMVTTCMDEYHYEMGQVGDAEQQVMTLGGELVNTFLDRERLKSENKELRDEIEHLKSLLEIQQTRRKSNGLQIGSYKYRSGRK